MLLVYLIDTLTGEIVDAGVDNEFSGKDAIHNLVRYLKDITAKYAPLHSQDINDASPPYFLLVIEKREDKRGDGYIFKPVPFLKIEVELIQKLKNLNFFLRKKEPHKLISHELLLIKTKGRLVVKSQTRKGL